MIHIETTHQWLHLALKGPYTVYIEKIIENILFLKIKVTKPNL